MDIQRREYLIGLLGVAVTACGGGGSSGAVSNAEPVKPDNRVWVVSTLAGGLNLTDSIDGTGTAALFHQPAGLALDGQGYLFVADYANQQIRRLELGTAAVLTWAGQHHTAGGDNGDRLSEATFNHPYALAVGPQNQIWVADTDNNMIRVISPEGVVSDLSGVRPQATPDDPDPSSILSAPSGIVVDQSGVVFVADSLNHVIRRFDSDGGVSIVAGILGCAGSADGTGVGASFQNPQGMALDTSGGLYVADCDNHLIRRIDLFTLSVSTLAGSAGQLGSADGTGTAAQFNQPTAIAVDAAGRVYVADSQNHLIRSMTPNGVVSTVAGIASLEGGYADGTGTGAEFQLPTGLAIDASGVLYVADANNQLIRRLARV